MIKNKLTKVIMVLSLLSLFNCISMYTVLTEDKAPAKKEGGVISVEVIIKKNFYDLRHSSGKIYHLVGLSKDERKALDKLNGEIIKVEIDVISETNNIERNAKLIRIL